MSKTLYIICMALAVTAGCQHKHDDHEHHEKEHGHVHAEGEIAFSDKQARMAGLELETVHASTFREAIKTSGRIMPAPGNEVTVAATADGIIGFQNGNLTEGSAVGKGRVLVSISSKHLMNGDAVEKARQSYETARREFERSKSLADDRLISVREFEQRKADYENARITYEGIATNATSTGVNVTVPMNGFVKSLAVKPGDYVSVGTAIATISSNRKLVLRAEVPESGYAKLHEINDANFTTPYDGCVYSLKDLDGRLLSYGKSAESGSGYVPVTFEFNNRGAVVPGAYVEVYLLGKQEEGVISLPVSSLTEEQGVMYVYVQTSEHHYEKREVVTGAADGRRVKVMKGVKAGERVVVKGATQVMLASRSTVIPEGHHH
ncbi:MAG TPA: efflux transporter periplasmic adaptor subunit [Prevotellaceae bacterium]|nr:efflux transporter periplasmic adaptor subunit [Prevotellaceae bacterium]